MMGFDGTKSIMLQGTGSYVGKSVLVAALCRTFKEKGFKVAPFKAQNMALNSYITKDGGEIGMAQAFQAFAAGVEPSVDMNPILLKPTSDRSSQVIIHGKVYSNMKAVEYHSFKKKAAEYVIESYKRLTDRYNLIIIEGAGSPAEINLRDGDIANMGLAEAINAPVLLVGDIDRGGVFASILGTIELLSPSERERVKGFIINKFRGDIDLLQPGIDFLETRTGLPALGIVPYINNMILPEEDGVALEEMKGVRCKVKGSIKIAVIKLSRISNYTDFDPLMVEPDVSLEYVDKPEGLEGADLVIIPGSKSTIGDMIFLRKSGLSDSIVRHYKKGGWVVGICGGFQMIGKIIKDPYMVESRLKESEGLGLLDVETILEKKKQTHQVEAIISIPFTFNLSPLTLKGYEIHMGKTIPLTDTTHFCRIVKRNCKPVEIADGAISKDGKAWGTYIHGIFNDDLFREAFLNKLRQDKGLSLRKSTPFIQKREAGIRRLAKEVQKNIDMDKIYNIIKT